MKIQKSKLKVIIDIQNKYQVRTVTYEKMVIASFGWWLITILAGDDLNYLLVSFCTYRYKFCCIFCFILKIWKYVIYLLKSIIQKPKSLHKKLLSHVRLFVTPWAAACQASLSFINSWSLLRLMSIESVMTFNHLVLCHPLLLLPSIFPSLWVFSNS